MKRKNIEGKNPRILKRKKGMSKSRCDNCRRLVRIRHLTYYKGKYLCNCCIQKEPNVQINHFVGPLISLKEAISRVYNVKTYTYGNHTTNTINVPSILEGEKVKLILVEKKEINKK